MNCIISFPTFIFLLLSIAPNIKFCLSLKSNSGILGLNISCGFIFNISFAGVNIFFCGVFVGVTSGCDKCPYFLCMYESKCIVRDTGCISSSKFAYVPALPFFSNCFASCFIKFDSAASPPSLVPRFNILLFLAVPRALAPVVTAPKKQPPTFLNLSLALAAVLLLYATPNAPTPNKPVTADAV